MHRFYLFIKKRTYPRRNLNCKNIRCLIIDLCIVQLTFRLNNPQETQENLRERETSVRSPETIDGNRRRDIWFRCFFYFHAIFSSFRIRSQRVTHPSLALTGFIEKLVSLSLFPPSLSGFAVPLLLSQWYSPTLASASLSVKYHSHLPRFRFVVVFFHANGSLLSPLSFSSFSLVFW